MIAQSTWIFNAPHRFVSGLLIFLVFPLASFPRFAKRSFRTIAFLGLFLAEVSPRVMAQNLVEGPHLGQVREILEKCARLHEQMERRELHLNERLINASRLNRHLPAYFQYFEQYFYTFDPRETNPPPLLRAVILKNEKKALMLYQEFVYDLQGHLIFYEERVGNEQQSPHFIYKLFFWDNQCIQVLQDKAQVQLFGAHRVLPQASQIQAEAQHWLNRFQSGFSDFHKP